MIRGLLVLMMLAAMPASPQAVDSAAVDNSGIRALGAASSVAAAILDDESGQPAAAVDGCYIWQQPGVALVITETWQPSAGMPELWLAEGRILDFLQAQADLRFEEPVLHPAEPAGGSDEFSLPAAVYVLDAEQAQRRLDQYLDNLDYWVELNPGMQFIIPAAAECQTDCAVVFVDSQGPLEFYFQDGGEHGGLRLIHLIHYDFFSA